MSLFFAASSADAQRGQGGRGSDTSPAEIELQKGISLTQTGKFADAIPHFLAARGQVANDYALSFNLALCYVATGKNPSAIELLNDLRKSGHDTADVENLLAQSLLGNRQPDEAFAAVQRAAHMTPKDEKLYVFVAEACMDSGYSDVGLKVAEIGLKNLPRSARVLLEHAMLLTQLDRLDEAKEELQKVTQLAPGSDVAYIAATQKNLFEGNTAEALRAAREGLRKGIHHSMLLALYGEAVMQSGIGPGDAEFAQARAALERAVAERPTYASAQIALGKLYLMDSRVDDAITHLNVARQLEPKNPAVYANLAAAYRRRGQPGDAQQADAMLAILARLNQEQADKIRSAPGDRKPGYAVQPPKKSPGPPPDRQPNSPLPPQVRLIFQEAESVVGAQHPRPEPRRAAPIPSFLLRASLRLRVSPSLPRVLCDSVSSVLNPDFFHLALIRGNGLSTIPTPSFTAII